MKVIKLLTFFMVSFVNLNCSKNNTSNPSTTKPQAIFESNYDGTTNAPVQTSFTNKSKNAISYIWDFGDGSSTSNSQYTTVWHTYYTLGTYTVTLTATGDSGDNSFTVRLVSIK